ncbi:uncharacterized protein ACRADG_006959 isoform 1-T2 [Cochliomyia hominivorax]
MSHNKNKKLNATDIANHDLYPNVIKFLQILVKDVDIEIKQVGEKFDYHFSIVKNNLFRNYGIFMDYFIRKCLSNRYEMELSDDITEHILDNTKEYFNGPGKNEQLRNDITKHYDIFKDSQNKTMDILESIRIVSLTYTMSFHDPLPKAKVQWRNENLLAINKYLQELPYRSVEMKPDVNCEYFNGNADLIFDQEVLYEIKTSKYASLKMHNQIKNFFKLFLYGFGYYKKTNQIINNYKIYNPLLGLEYTVHLDNIDMIRFEQALKKDSKNISK